MNNILSVKKLSKNYKDFKLDNINFEIKKGEVIGFIGSNGAGKTTTIKSILNLIKLDSGNIKVFGKYYKDDEENIKDDIGVVLNDSFFPDMLNLYDINIILKNIYKRWNEDKYFKLIERFNLPKEKQIKDYSTGMLVKLKIITALSHNPKFLVLDEPTSGLDPVARTEILEMFEEFMTDKEKSILISSHITTDLEEIADKIIFIDNGKILLNENKKTILNNYGTVKLNKDEFNKLDKNDIEKYKINKNEYKVLILNKDSFKRKYKNFKINDISLEELMVLYIKGE